MNISRHAWHYRLNYWTYGKWGVPHISFVGDGGVATIRVYTQVNEQHLPPEIRFLDGKYSATINPVEDVEA